MSNPAVKLQRELAQDVSDVRPELVEKFRVLIAAGRYHVTDRDIAQAMMDKGVFDDLMVPSRLAV